MEVTDDALVITAVPSDDGLPEIRVVNDKVDKCSLLVKVERWSFEGELLASEDLPVEVPYAVSVKAGKLPELGKDSFAYLRLMSDDGMVHATHTVIPGEYKDCPLAAADIKVKTAVKGSSRTVTLETDKPAFFVWVEAEGVKAGSAITR